MLLILSDLHFTDETTAVNVNPEAFDLLSGFVLDTMTRQRRPDLSNLWVANEFVTGLAREYQEILLLDVNWRELEHAFPGHPMFSNFRQIMGG